MAKRDFKSIKEAIAKDLDIRLTPLSLVEQQVTEDVNYSASGKLGSDIRQKWEHIFLLFAEAYDATNGNMASASFRDEIYLGLKHGGESEKANLLEIFCTTWDNWLFAWNEGMRRGFISIRN